MFQGLIQLADMGVKPNSELEVVGVVGVVILFHSEEQYASN